MSCPSISEKQELIYYGMAFSYVAERPKFTSYKSKGRQIALLTTVRTSKHAPTIDALLPLPCFLFSSLFFRVMFSAFYNSNATFLAFLLGYFLLNAFSAMSGCI